MILLILGISDLARTILTSSFVVKQRLWRELVLGQRDF